MYILNPDPLERLVKMYAPALSLIAAAAQVTTDALSALSEALGALGLCINSSKTSSMFILPSQVEGNVCECITYRGSPLEIVSHVRCLGLIVDDALSWKNHVDHIITKVGKKIGALRRVRRQLTPQARRQFLLSVIQPDFEYCSVAFLTSLPVRERERLLATYRRALRAMAGADLHDDCDAIAKQHSILPILQRWLSQLALFAFECHSQPVSTSLGSLFTRLPSTHVTRGTLNEDVVVPRYNKKAGTCSLSFRLAVLWNSFSTEAKRSKSLLEFCSAVCAMLDSPSAVSRFKSLVFDSISLIPAGRRSGLYSSSVFENWFV